MRSGLDRRTVCSRRSSGAEAEQCDGGRPCSTASYLAGWRVGAPVHVEFQTYLPPAGRSACRGTTEHDVLPGDDPHYAGLGELKEHERADAGSSVQGYAKEIALRVCLGEDVG